MKRVLQLLTTGIMLFVLPQVLRAAPTPEPPKEPILRVETTQHTAQIWQITSDAGGRFLVTASGDKTARLWDATSGKLLRVFRPPASGTNEGKIYTAVISPDASMIACAGWTNLGSETGHTIYLFRRSSGAMLSRITGLPETIHSLSFSRDGRLLAATTGIKRGIRVYQVDSGFEVFKDGEYTGLSQIAFGPAGRLAVTSYDGQIRLYDSRFTKVASIQAPGGKQPRGLDFSPDGNKLAVGYVDSNRVDIFSGNDLQFLFSANTNDVSPTNYFATVAWSLDGTDLYAGGTHKTKTSAGSRDAIRRWSNSGSGPYHDIAVAENAISSLAALPHGRIAYSAQDPVIGVLDRNNNPVVRIDPQTTDFRGMNELFRVSTDGRSVSFPLTYRSKSTLTFNSTERSLDIKPDSTRQLDPPLIKHATIQVTDWKNNRFPKLNGTPIKLRDGETSRVLSILPDGSGFVLGTDWGLRYYTTDGKLTWHMTVPATVWGVTIAWQARLVVVAYGDGTIRWQRLSDGKIINSFFPHRDHKRWVFWAPGGYYDASAGGEDLIGWHVNNGRGQAADYFTAAKFRSTRYRPDIVARMFETLDISEAVRLANSDRGSPQAVKETDISSALPPVVSIVSPADSSTIASANITVRYTVRSPSNEPVTTIRVLVDGRPIATNRGLKAVNKDASEQSVQVTVPERNSEVSIIAENRFSASEPATVRLTWAGKAQQQDEYIIKPKLYVLAVGVSAYKLPDLRLQFASKDARDFAAAVQAQKGGMYRDVTVKLLPDASKDDVLDGLEWLQKEVTSKDVAMVFLAGHGVNDSAGTYYFLPVNVDPDKLKRTGVPFSDIKNTLSALAGKAILFVDTCHSGNVMGSGRRALTDVNAIVNELASAENGVVVFASSTGRQYSLEDKAWGNGAFTKALVEGLKGKADLMGKGKITINMLDAWLAERVKELTGGKQTPTTTKPTTVPDFPVAMRK